MKVRGGVGWAGNCAVTALAFHTFLVNSLRLPLSCTEPSSTVHAQARAVAIKPSGKSGNGRTSFDLKVLIILTHMRKCSNS